MHPRHRQQLPRRPARYRRRSGIPVARRRWRQAPSRWIRWRRPVCFARPSRIRSRASSRTALRLLCSVRSSIDPLVPSFHQTPSPTRIGEQVEPSVRARRSGPEPAGQRTAEFLRRIEAHIQHVRRTAASASEEAAPKGDDRIGAAIAIEVNEIDSNSRPTAVEAGRILNFLREVAQRQCMRTGLRSAGARPAWGSDETYETAPQDVECSSHRGVPQARANVSATTVCAADVASASGAYTCRPPPAKKAPRQGASNPCGAPGYS